MTALKSIVVLATAFVAGCAGQQASPTSGSEHQVVDSRTQAEGSSQRAEAHEYHEGACDGTCAHKDKDPAFVRAKEAMGKEDWDGAISIMAEKTSSEPDNAKAWQLYGYALHAAGRLDEALPIHEKAASFEKTRATALYNVACVHALKGDSDAAFEALNKAAEAGFAGAEYLAKDTDLDSIRADERFGPVVEAVKNNPRPEKAHKHDHEHN